MTEKVRENHQHAFLALGWWLVSWVMAIIGGASFSAAENIPLHRGIYWALATVTTVGYGDIVPHNGWGYFIADATMSLTIPAWSLAIAFATSWVVSLHIWHSHKKTQETINQIKEG